MENELRIQSIDGQSCLTFSDFQRRDGVEKDDDRFWKYTVGLESAGISAKVRIEDGMWTLKLLEFFRQARDSNGVGKEIQEFRIGSDQFVIRMSKTTSDSIRLEIELELLNQEWESKWSVQTKMEIDLNTFRNIGEGLERFFLIGAA